MRKNFCSLLTAVCLLTTLVGCGSGAASGSGSASSSGAQSTPASSSAAAGSATTESTDAVRVASLKGPTTMGLVKLMADSEADGKYKVTMYTAADEIVPLIAKGEVDIALIPSNLAATLYQKTEQGIQVIDINSANVLCFVSDQEKIGAIESVTQLKGKTLYMTGKGATPEWTLLYLLKQNGMTEDDLTIEFKSEGTEVASALAENTEAIGLLPQPFAQVAVQQNSALTATDVSNEWIQYSDQNVQGGTVNGVTVVRKEFLEQNKAAVDQFITDQQASADYISQNPAEGAALIEQYNIVKAAVAEPILEYHSPVTIVTGDKMKAWLGEYLEKLYEVSPDAVGGKLPDDGFYYLG